VTGNTAYNNAAGIAASGGCTINANTTYNNREDGIDASKACVVTGNTAYFNQNVGIYAPAACTVSGNTVGYNNQSNTVGFAGLYVKYDCLVKGNAVVGNKQNNIYVEEGGNAIEENLVTSCNPGNGIYFADSNNFYANNRARGNGTDYAGSLPTGAGDGGGNVSF
jgi:parallel beta-helix repeat protein